MESNREITEFKFADLATARFTDQLDPGQEETWEDLMTSLAQSYSGIQRYHELASILKDLWLDTTIPQIYRDRAMLRLIQDYYVFDDPTGVSVGGWGDYTNRIIEFTADELVQRDQWYQDVLDYTLKNSEYVLGPSRTMMLAVDLFDKEVIDQQQFEFALNLVATLNPGFQEVVTNDYNDGSGPRSYKRSVLPEYARYDTDQYYKLRFWRFPVLDDVFTGALVKRGSSKRSVSWAVQQLDTWLDYKSGNVSSDELPGWLATIEDKDHKTTEALFHSRQGDIYRLLIHDTAPIISWEMYEKAVRCIGWRAVTSEIAVPPENNDGQQRVRMRFDYVLKLVSKIDKKEFADDLLLHYLRSYYAEIDSKAYQDYKATGNTDPTELERRLIGNDSQIDQIDRKLKQLPGESELAKHLLRIKADLLEKNRARQEGWDEQRRLIAERDAKYARERRERDARQIEAANKVPELLNKLKNDKS